MHRSDGPLNEKAALKAAIPGNGMYLNPKGIFMNVAIPVDGTDRFLPDGANLHHFIVPQFLTEMLVCYSHAPAFPMTVAVAVTVAVGVLCLVKDGCVISGGNTEFHLTSTQSRTNCVLLWIGSIHVHTRYKSRTVYLVSSPTPLPPAQSRTVLWCGGVWWYDRYGFGLRHTLYEIGDCVIRWFCAGYVLALIRGSGGNKNRSD